MAPQDSSPRAALRFPRSFLGLLVTSFLLVALAIPSLALWLRARGSRPLPQRLERLGPIRDLLHAIGDAPRGLVRDRGLVVRVAMFNGLVFLADSLTLACCLAALGQPAAVGAAFVALMAASVVVTLGPMYLLDEAQGRGTGGRLMDEFLTWAGSAPMRLWVTDYNERAIRFYQRYGFKATGERELWRGKLPNMRMIRDATSSGNLS